MFLQELFKNATNQHYYNTRGGYHNKLHLPQVRITHHGLQSIRYKSAKAWNEIKTKISETNSTLAIGHSNNTIGSQNHLKKNITSTMAASCFDDFTAD